MGKVYGVTINQDVKCKKCGKPGACKPYDSEEYGLCLNCVNKNLERKYSMTIGSQIMSRVKAEISGLLDIHQANINQSYLDNEDALTMNLGIKFEPTKESNIIKTTVGISFIESKVNKKISFEIDEKQRPLFDESDIQSSTQE